MRHRSSRSDFNLQIHPASVHAHDHDHDHDHERWPGECAEWHSQPTPIETHT